MNDYVKEIVINALMDEIIEEVKESFECWYREDSAKNTKILFEGYLQRQAPERLRKILSNYTYEGR